MHYFTSVYLSAIKQTVTRQCIAISGRSACKYVSTYEKEGNKENKETNEDNLTLFVNINPSCILHSGTAPSFFAHEP
jgi:hypothetical protein